jgi:GTPase
LPQLVEAVAAVISGETKTKPLRAEPPAEVARAIAELAPMIEELAPGLPNARWVAMRLLDGDHEVRQALLSGELADLVRKQSAPVEKQSELISLHGGQ